VVGLEVTDRTIVRLRTKRTRRRSRAAEVGQDELNVKFSGVRVAAGELDQLLGNVGTDDVEAAAAELERVTAGAAGEMEDALIAAGLEDLQGAVDFGTGPIGPGHLGAGAFEPGRVPVLRDLL
jgi:hypothetical protein